MCNDPKINSEECPIRGQQITIEQSIAEVEKEAQEQREWLNTHEPFEDDGAYAD